MVSVVRDCVFCVSEITPKIRRYRGGRGGSWGIVKAEKDPTSWISVGTGTGENGTVITYMEDKASTVN